MWPEYFFSAWAPLAQQTATPRPPRVESPASGQGSAPLSGGNFDPFANQPHGGNPDLVEHPATHTELALAKCELNGDEGAYDALLAYTLTPERTAAVLAQARRIARAEQIWARHQ